MVSLLDTIKSAVNSAFITTAASTPFKDGLYCNSSPNVSWDTGDLPDNTPDTPVLYLRTSFEKLAQGAAEIPQTDATFLVLQTSRAGEQVHLSKGGLLQTDSGLWRIMEIRSRDPANVTYGVHCRPVNNGEDSGA